MPTDLPVAPAPAVTSGTPTTRLLGLSTNAQGQLVMAVPGAEAPVPVTPVRAFPLQAPLEGISLMGRDGHEVAWIEHMSHLSSEEAALVVGVLAWRDFTPEIDAIERVSGYTTPCTWTVRTRQGHTRFELAAEEHIRRLDEQSLLIADTSGLHFRVDLQRLDRNSRRILERFM